MFEATAEMLGEDGKHLIASEQVSETVQGACRETGFPTKVCNFMKQGFSFLVGVEPPSPLFPSRPNPQIHSRELDSQAVWRRRERCCQSGHKSYLKRICLSERRD